MHRDLRPAVVLLGLPGAGKGTIARRLAAERGYTHVDMGAVLRERAGRGDAVGDRIAIAQARGVMVPKEVVLAALSASLEALPGRAPLVLDGFPRTTAQVAAADDGRVPVRVHLAVWLDVPECVAAERIRQRGAVQPRADDAPAVVVARLSLTRETVEETRMLYERRGILEWVDGSGTPSAVYDRVAACTAASMSLV